MNALLQGIQSGAQIGETIQSARYNRMLAPLLEQQDFAGAARVAGQRGRADDALAFAQAGEQRQQQLSEQQRAQAQREFEQVKARYQAMGNLYQGASRVPEAQRAQFVASVLPQLAQQGVQIDPSQITPEMLTDANMPLLGAQLQALGAQIDREGERYGFTQLGRTLIRVNERSGEAVPVFSAPEQPERFEMNGVLVQVGPDGQAQELYRAPPPPPPALTPYQARSLELQELGLALRAEQAGQPSATEQRYAREDTRRAREAQAALESFEARTDTLISTIDEAIDLIDRPTSVAGLGGLTGFIGGTDTAQLNARLSTIAANLGFQEIQSLRNSVGSIGPLTDRDMQLFQDAAGSLTLAQGEAALRQQLLNLKRGAEMRLAQTRRVVSEELQTLGVGGSQPAPSPAPPGAGGNILDQLLNLYAPRQ